MLLRSQNIHQTIAFFSKRISVRTTFDELMNATYLAENQVLAALDKLVEYEICEIHNGFYSLNQKNYFQLLESEIKDYKQIIDQYWQIKDRILLLLLFHGEHNGAMDLNAPTLLVESVSDDKRFIHKSFSTIEGIEIRISPTNEIMSGFIESPEEARKLSKGIVLSHDFIKE